MAGRHWKRITTLAMLHRDEFAAKLKEARKMTREEQQMEIRQRKKVKR